MWSPSRPCPIWSPEVMNSDPYGAWLIKVENVEGSEELLDAAAYEAFCTEEG